MLGSVDLEMIYLRQPNAAHERQPLGANVVHHSAAIGSIRRLGCALQV